MSTEPETVSSAERHPCGREVNGRNRDALFASLNRDALFVYLIVWLCRCCVITAGKQEDAFEVTVCMLTALYEDAD